MTFIGWIVVTIFVFALLSLFFSVNSIALRTYSRSKLQEAFKELGRENLVDVLVERTEKLALACSLYRLILHLFTLLLLVAAIIRGQTHPPTLTDLLFAFLMAIALFSFFSLAIPHAWAKYSGEIVLSRSWRLLVIFAAIVAPILYVLSLYDAIIRRLAGVVEVTPEEKHEEKQEEFLTNLEHQRLEGVVDAEEQQMIENVLDFSETTAGEIMTPRTDVIAVEVGTDLNSVLTTVNVAGHSRVPVYEETIDNIIGFVYAKDLLAEIGKDPAEFKLKDKMREAYFVPETKPLRALLREFQNQKLHIAVVLDEYGGTAGIITIEDILEELVGEIADEYEEAEAEQIKRIDENTVEADARVYIDDINDQLELDLPEEEDYETLAGFVFSHLGYIPKAGETFEYKNIKFTILAAEPRRIDRIKIHFTPERYNADKG
ncbi:MAG: hemolysin family protein [Phycisphaerae bacterium]|nr:hemolysin family protein [Phycisphaerae bacterium]